MKRLSKAVRMAVAACMAFAVCGVVAGCSSGEEYTPQLGSPKISSPAIGEDGTLRVGVNTNNSPLAGKSGDCIIGIDVDIAAALADDLGLKLDVVDVGNNATDAIDNGEVDVVLGIDSTSKHDGYWTSSQYLPTGVVLFAPEGNDEPAPTADSDVKIAAQVSSKSAWAVTNTFGEDSLVSSSDLASAFSDLGSGKVDYVASDAIIGMYAASRQDVNVEIRGPPRHGRRVLRNVRKRQHRASGSHRKRLGRPGVERHRRRDRGQVAGQARQLERHPQGGFECAQVFERRGRRRTDHRRRAAGGRRLGCRLKLVFQLVLVGFVVRGELKPLEAGAEPRRINDRSRNQAVRPGVRLYVVARRAFERDCRPRVRLHAFPNGRAPSVPGQRRQQQELLHHLQDACVRRHGRLPYPRAFGAMRVAQVPGEGALRQPAEKLDADVPQRHDVPRQDHVPGRVHQRARPAEPGRRVHGRGVPSQHLFEPPHIRAGRLALRAGRLQRGRRRLRRRGRLSEGRPVRRPGPRLQRSRCTTR